MYFPLLCHYFHVLKEVEVEVKYIFELHLIMHYTAWCKVRGGLCCLGTQYIILVIATLLAEEL